MNTKIRASAILVLALPLAGCDILYGVGRGAQLDKKPELACVEETIRATPGITEVKFESDHSGKGLFHPAPWTYSYLYRGKDGSNIIGSLQIVETYDGAVTMGQSLWQLNAPPPQAWVDATRPVMRAIEMRLAERCGIRDLPSRIKETCDGVRCLPLDQTRSNGNG
jgi:hypothetical protein